ncbi:hypothetical protein M8523_08170 [Hyphomicrobiales bacterium BP6-180914]|uniref:Uncharacterized protein n=2 Tax=Lichenifustis flavocetrariae TaxID=2949735 RepID=A0AA41YVC0_9HYPH|nr:hypothetical protein [Lichenifustis flavocetrariae]
MPPISVGARPRETKSRFGTGLSVFMRCVAVLWIAEGLLQWTNVLTDPSGAIMSSDSPLHIAALFFFCVLDFVAAVGLWLVAPWGAAVWMATILGHVVVVALAPDFLPGPAAVITSDVVLLSAYCALAWWAARNETT